MSVAKEFREFIAKGNVIDLAVGVIIGGAFGRIVSSLVEDVIMPPIGYIMGGVDFADKKIILTEANAAAEIEEVAIRYGVFTNSVIQFLIIAACVFLLVKAINSLRRKEEQKPAAPAAPGKEELLLTEIRDILKRNSGQS